MGEYGVLRNFLEVNNKEESKGTMTLLVHTFANSCLLSPLSIPWRVVIIMIEFALSWARSRRDSLQDCVMRTVVLN